MQQEVTCFEIHDAISSTSNGQNCIISEESQWFSSWEALDQFKQDHNVSVLNGMTINTNDGATNERQIENSKGALTECDTISVPSTSFSKPRGRLPGKKKMSIIEKKQKDAERKKKSR